MARKTKPKYAIGQTVKTNRFLPGYPLGVHTGAWVEVEERRWTGGRWRYNLKRALLGFGVPFWADEEDISTLG